MKAPTMQQGTDGRFPASLQDICLFFFPSYREVDSIILPQCCYTLQGCSHLFQAKASVLPRDGSLAWNGDTFYQLTHNTVLTVCQFAVLSWPHLSGELSGPKLMPAVSSWRLEVAKPHLYGPWKYKHRRVSRNWCDIRHGMILGQILLLEK